MKKRMLALLILCCLAFTVLHGQTVDTLKLIYNRMKTDTRPYESVKERWEVRDQETIREVLVQILNRPALALEEVDTIRTNMPRLIERNNAGQMSILCTKRTDDDELETVEFNTFASPKETLGTLRDYVLIEDALGADAYRLLRDFPHTQYQPDQFDSKQRNRCDIYLHALNPDITLWSTITLWSDRKPSDYQLFRVAAFGRLGNDLLTLPFWFKGSMVAAVRVTYVDSLSIIETVDRNYSMYSISIGIDEPINFSVPGSATRSPNSIFKERRLEGSGTAIYLKGSYTPWHTLDILSDRKQEHLQFNVEAALALQQKEEYAPEIPDTFYSIRNYVTLSAYLQHVGIFNFGAGVSWHDLSHFSKPSHVGQPAFLLRPSSNNFLPFFEIGVSQDGDLLQYLLSTQMNYNASLGYGFFVVKSVIMLSNTVGFDLRYFKAVRSSHLPPWQYDNYIVFSPIIRINY